MYVMGIDGGGTKTHCRIENEEGQVIGEGFSGGSNHQVVGLQRASEAYALAIEMALSQGGLTMEQMSGVAFGLAGADEAYDFSLLQPICDQLCGEIPHQVVNDSWIGLYSGAAYGVVSICGTGSAHAGIRQDGRHVTLRNLNYVTGNYGGGGEILAQALHYAFRSYEGTFKKSALEEALMKLAGVQTMDELSQVVRDTIPKELAYQIPIEAAKVAARGDEVAQMIFARMGQSLGQYACGVIRQLEMETMAVPLVLIGSVFQAEVPYLNEAYLKEVKKVAPAAYSLVPKVAPVSGAIYLAKRLVAKED